MTLIIVPAGYQREYFDYTEPSRTWWDEQCRAVYEESQPTPIRKARVINGVYQWDPWSNPTIKQHGWPRPFLVRSIPTKPELEPYPPIPREEQLSRVSWTRASNWPLQATAWRIHPGNLLLCIGVWVGVVCGAGAVTEWWVRRRGGLWRFRLIDLLALATVVALVVGWWSHHKHVKQLENNIIEQADRSFDFYPDYVAPVWLARLAGDESSLPHFWHITNALHREGALGNEELELILGLPYVKELKLYDQVPMEALDHLATRELEELSISAPSSIDAPLIAERLHKLAHPNLRRLDLELTDLIVEDVEGLLNATDLEELHLQNPMVRVAEVDQLREQHPNVKIEVFWNLQFKHDSEQAEEAIVEARLRRGFD